MRSAFDNVKKFLETWISFDEHVAKTKTKLSLMGTSIMSDDLKGLLDSGMTVYPHKDVLADIAFERWSQIMDHKFDADHDDKYKHNELGRAAACYAVGVRSIFDAWNQSRSIWPWEPKWWKPNRTNRRKDLIKAAALIVAEIERLDRAQSKEAVGGIKFTDCYVDNSPEEKVEEKAKPEALAKFDVTCIKKQSWTKGEAYKVNRSVTLKGQYYTEHGIIEGMSINELSQKEYDKYEEGKRYTFTLTEGGIL